MRTKLHNIGMRIARVTAGWGDDYIEVSVIDEDSRVTLAEVEFPLATFTECVTGLWVSGLAGETMVEDPRIGLKRVMTKHTVSVPDLGYGNDKYVEWFNSWKLTQPPAEYSITPGSKGFITGYGDNKTLMYHVITYEPIENGLCH